jgi:hypothetical protein
MEALLGAGLAIGVCCGLPLAIGGTAFLLNKARRKSGSPQAHPSQSMLGACCQAPAALAKRTVRRLRGQDPLTPA